MATFDRLEELARWLDQWQAQRETLAVFRLETGRTHQIRVHMAHLGCPLMGDDLYGGEKSEAFPRQALHCAALRFASPQGEEVRLISPFPPQLLEAAGLGDAQPLLRRVCEEFLHQV